MADQIAHSLQSTNLADIIERVLDKGIVIAGDILVKVADVELLTIKIRLLVASVDKAKEMGINWWETDSYLSPRTEALEEENRKLQQAVDALSAKVTRIEQTDLSLVEKFNRHDS